MAFSDNVFTLFLIGFSVLFFLFPYVLIQNLLLLSGSALFLAYSGLSNLWVALFAIVVGWAYFAARRAGADNRLIMLLAIALLLGNLIFFKYRLFFADTAGIQLPPFFDIRWAIPLGISYYTFELIGAIYDRRNMPQQVGIDRVALFVLFFPRSIAGPIVKYRPMMPQFDFPKRFSRRQFMLGFHLFLLGYCKKVLIADPIALVIDPVFANEANYSALTLFVSAIGFYVQVYADFSGYTDMGRGVARILGFRLPINFRAPYLGASPFEFWSRWHMSLTNWIRQYVYTSLAMQVARRLRKPLLRQLGLFGTLMIVFIVVGLWHGAAWRFVLFGIVHGIVISIWFLVTRGRLPKTPLGHVFGVVVTQLFVMLSLIVFRVPAISATLDYFSGLATWRPGADVSLWGMGYVIAGLIAVLSIQAVDYHATRRNIARAFASWRESRTAIGVYATVFALMYISKVLLGEGVISTTPGEFIYFNF